MDRAVLVLSEFHLSSSLSILLTFGGQSEAHDLQTFTSSSEELRPDRTPDVFRALGSSDRLQKTRQLRCRLGLRLQFFERAGQGAGQALHGSCLELLMHRLKAQVVHSSRQMLGKASFFLDECPVDEQLGGSRGQCGRM